LEGIIWRYRALVGVFGSDVGKPEFALSEAVREWMDEIVGSANLQSTDVLKDYPRRIYKHHQDAHSANTAVSLDLDDYHSPVKPERYIELRLKTTMSFYKKRIPIYTRRRAALKTTLLLCALTASALAYFRKSTWVVVVTALAGTVTSWSEFADMSRKVQRYTGAIQNIKKLLVWWNTLSDVEKAGVENIASLIEGGEAVISEERVAWKSTAAANKQVVERSDEPDGNDLRSASARRRVHPA